MRPLTIITGILMGSSVAITLGLAVVIILFLVTGLDEPRIQDEFPALTSSIGLFVCLTAAGVASFIGEVRRTRWRWWAQAAMWAMVGLIAWRYWPAS